MTTFTLERTVGKLVFSNPLIIGAGVCKTLADVKRAIDSAVGGVELGSITPKERAGNSGDNFYAHFEKGVLIYTLNSLGMPNPGKEDVSTWAREAITYAHDRGKLIGVNVTGDTIEEIVMMVLWALDLGFDWVTINAGCPNKFKDGVPQSILSFDLDGTNELMHELSRQIGYSGTEIWWKPSPNDDTLGTQLQSWALVSDCKSITGTTLNNTVPHSFAYSDTTGTQAIPYGSGHAGMGGPAVKPKALGDLIRYKDLYPGCNAVGAGGVTYGVDILDFIRGGADAVMCTSVLWANDLDYRILGAILGDFCEEMGIDL